MENRGKTLLHEQLAGLDLHNTSKCQLLKELSGVDECHSFEGYGTRSTPCAECRRKQRAALVSRILDEYEPKGDR